MEHQIRTNIPALLSVCPQTNLCLSPHFEKHFSEMETEKGQGQGYSTLKRLAWRKWGEREQWQPLNYFASSQKFQTGWAIFSSLGLLLHELFSPHLFLPWSLPPHSIILSHTNDRLPPMCPDSLFRASWLHMVSVRLCTDTPSPSVSYKTSLWVAVAMLPKYTVKHIPLLVHWLQLPLEEGWTRLVATREVMATGVFTRSRDCLKGFQNQLSGQ